MHFDHKFTLCKSQHLYVIIDIFPPAYKKI